MYKVSAHYSPQHDAGIRFDDALLGIDWRIRADALLLSAKDRMLPSFDPEAEYFP